MPNDLAANQPKATYSGVWCNVQPPISEAPGGLWPEAELDRRLRSMAFDWIRAHPTQALGIGLIHIVHFWRPGFGWSGLRPRAASLFYFGQLVASLSAVVRAVRQGTKQVMLLAVFVYGLTALAVVSVGIPRYRLPLHPFLAILTAAAFTTAWHRRTTLVFRKRA